MSRRHAGPRPPRTSYGTHAAYSIEEVASVDPVTGVSTPEVRRQYTFGLALTLPTLEGAKAAATEGRSLAEFVAANERTA